MTDITHQPTVGPYLLIRSAAGCGCAMAQAERAGHLLVRRSMRHWRHSDFDSLYKTARWIEPHQVIAEWPTQPLPLRVRNAALAFNADRRAEERAEHESWRGFRQAERDEAAHRHGRAFKPAP